MDRKAKRPRAAMNEVAQGFADRFRKTDVRHNPIAKKRMFVAAAGPVKELRGQHDVARRILRLKASHRRHAQNPAHPQRSQRENIRPMIELMRHDPVPAAMARKKIDLPAREFPPMDDIRRRSEGSFNGMLREIGKPFEVIKSASADDANGWF